MREAICGLAILGVLRLLGGAALAQGLVGATKDESALNAPLASTKESESFHSTYDGILREAAKGTVEDRKKATELLKQRAGALHVSLGEKRLLLMAALDLMKAGEVPNQDFVAFSKQTLDALQDRSISVMVARIRVLSDMASRDVAAESAELTDQIGEEYLAVARLHERLGMLKEAGEDLTQAQRWLARDPRYASGAVERVAIVGKEIRRQVEVENFVALHPDDPEANRQAGFAILERSGSPAAAAMFFAKVDKPQYRQLAAALSKNPQDVDSRLTTAIILSDALKSIPAGGAAPIAKLAQAAATAVSGDSAATGNQRARADLVSIKLKRSYADLLADDPASTSTAASRVMFFNLEALPDSKRIVYIVDHSGSMLDSFEYVKKETKRSIQSLTAVQSFAVIGVSDEAEVIGEKQLQRASDDRKRHVSEALDGLVAQGQNDDLLPPFQHAFEQTFAMRPDTIYFLTDGHFGGRLIDVVRKLNASGKTHINTVAFVNHDASYETQLRELAKANGGKYTFVSEQDAKGR